MSPPSRKPAARSSPTTELGNLAEDLVADWLIQQGWTLLHRHWHCRWGELDLVALAPAIAYVAQPPQSSLVFVEVKARSKGNWDEDGLLAISTQKQTKLWRAAEMFLAQQPHLAELPCRFDVALVGSRRSRSGAQDATRMGAEVLFGRAIAGYVLTLQQYIPDAFSG